MKKILITDIETTDLKPHIGHIVEVGIVSLDLDSGDREIIFNQVMHEKGITKHEVEMSWIIKKGWMTVEEIRYSKTLDYYRPEIQNIMNDYPLGMTAYNKQFDFAYLGDRDFFYKELPCPMKLMTNVCKISGKYGNYKWPSVTEAYNFLFPKNDYDEIHRGADDAFHEAEIVYELYKRGLFKL